MSLVTMSPAVLARQAWGQVARDVMVKPNANDQRNLLIAYGMPDYFEAARQGKVFIKSFDDAGTSKGPIATTPLKATAASWFLWNGNSAGSGICLIPIQVSYLLDSGTSTVGLCALGVQVPKGDQTPFYADATGVLTSNANGSLGIGSAYLGTGKTMVGAQAAWTTFAGSPTLGAVATHGATAGSVELDGMFVVPPQGGIAFEVFGDTTGTPLFNLGVVYIETACDVGV